ncbi:MAG: hypothetical protein CBD18_08695 [Opitutales bacterium TMED158]|nr:MAG: hypothetical protein CBD18_08695 [Opitutales bacterium TMED158]
MPRFSLFAFASLFVLLKGMTAPSFDELLRPAFETHCVACHGENDKIKGDLNLFEIQSESDLLRDLDQVQAMIDVLDFEEMPPEEEAPLPAETRARLLERLVELRDETLASGRSYPDTPIRRMNRFQYNNAVQDLFELEAEVFTLPERMAREYGDYFQPASGSMPETLKVGSRPLGKSQLIEKRLAGVAPFPQDLRAEHGFDTQADHLSLSPLLMESFLKLSRSIVDSPDFHERSCGIWDRFFAPPNSDEELDSIVEGRIRPFLEKAFRRPVDTKTLQRYASHAIERIQSGDSFENAMKSVASATIASPRFLYLYDQSEDSGSLADNFNLASRLSFFLWGSLPDSELIELAASGQLQNPDTLIAQTERMLADDRLKRFADSFPSQWLQLERIITSVPDRDRYSNFYFAKYRASMHMMLEPLLLFETILVENRPILELIDSDYSYRSDLLEAWYREDFGKPRTPSVQLPFQRVPILDRRQGGVITTAAVMTMTSNSTRTQPITRGAWVASVIFNNPPKPPPADVPPLPEEEEAGDAIHDLTLRERFEAHRAKPECASCHTRIDPLGFAFENYDAAGLWREHYENGLPVDASGSLLRKYAFQNIVEFKDALLAERDRFTRAFAGHVLAFALGRPTTTADSPALDRIANATADDGYRMQTLLTQVILSEPFTRSDEASISNAPLALQRSTLN